MPTTDEVPLLIKLKKEKIEAVIVVYVIKAYWLKNKKLVLYYE
jgi:hypothetical protein